jgi:hypothetical protein
MVGNDVIDLGDLAEQPDTIDSHFDVGVFAPSELEMLGMSGAPDRLRWILWAAKEAAYKVVRKLDARASFCPSRFVVTLDASLCGCVEHEGRSLPLRIEEDTGRVHAIVSSCETSMPRLHSRSAPVERPEDADAAACALAIDTIAPVLGVPPDDLEIVRSERFPLLFWRGGRACGELSLSHHGRFAAFVCEVSAGARPWSGKA